jgi:hypothetical protein
MTSPPDWVTAVPPTSGVHPSGTPAQLRQIGSTFLEQFLGVVVKAIVGVFLPGSDGAAFAQLQTWATDIESLIGDVPAEIATGLQDILTTITNLVNSLNAFALVNDVLSIPAVAWNDILSLLASLQGQVTAINSNPGGPSQTDDFSTVSLTGTWTSVL